MYLTATRNLKDALEKYVRSSKYPDMEKLRELLSKVTDEQKLNILQQTKGWCDRTALHYAADRGDAEMITTILSSLQSSDRLKLLMMRDFIKRTPLHTAAWRGHTESVKVILNSLTSDQQMQLLTAEDKDGEAAVETASGETADVLFEYKNKAKEKADPGEYAHLTEQSTCSCSLILVLVLTIICHAKLGRFNVLHV